MKHSKMSTSSFPSPSSETKQTFRALRSVPVSAFPCPPCAAVLPEGFFFCCLTHLVEAKEAQVSDHVEGADPGAGGDLSSHLQADLDDLQRVGENHLGSSGLEGRIRKADLNALMAVVNSEPTDESALWPAKEISNYDQ